MCFSSSQIPEMTESAGGNGEWRRQSRVSSARSSNIRAQCEFHNGSAAFDEMSKEKMSWSVTEIIRFQSFVDI